MAMTLESSSRHVTLPKYARDGLKELIQQNFAKNRALDGTLWVDFYNNIGGWVVKFDVITKDEYDEIRALYDDQFSNEEFLTLNDPGIPVADLSVFLNMPAERDLSWNKSVCKNLKITLEPESANS